MLTVAKVTGKFAGGYADYPACANGAACPRATSDARDHQAEHGRDAPNPRASPNAGTSPNLSFNGHSKQAERAEP